LSQGRENDLPPDLRIVRDALRALPPVAPRPEFRERLRRDFISGSLRGALPAAPGGWSWRELFFARPAVRWALLPAAGLAAVLVAAVLYNSTHRPVWSVAQVTPEGAIWVDGARVDASRLAGEIPAFRGGERIRLENGAQLDLMLPGKVVLQAAPATEFEVPKAPGPLLAGAIRGAIQRGEVRLSTGPDFPGSRLIMQGSMAMAEVTGTTLSVLCNPDSTCVCVFDGAVAMVDNRGATEMVRAGTRRTVYSQEKPALLEPILPMETMKLSMLRDAAGQRFRGEER